MRPNHDEYSDKSKKLAALSYMNILVLLPIFNGKDSEFVRFHANQGLIMFIVQTVYVILYFTTKKIVYDISWRLGFLMTILSVLGVALLILTIRGIIDALYGNTRKLPLLGNIKILK